MRPTRIWPRPPEATNTSTPVMHSFRIISKISNLIESVITSDAGPSLGFISLFSPSQLRALFWARKESCCSDTGGNLLRIVRRGTFWLMHQLSRGAHPDSAVNLIPAFVACHCIVYRSTERMPEIGCFRSVGAYPYEAVMIRWTWVRV